MQVVCQFKASDDCMAVMSIAYRDARDNMDRNNGKYICRPCSQKIKYTGRLNPNCRYKSLDDHFFSSVSTEAKSYLLGWIASDGHISESCIQVEIKDVDRDVIEVLRDVVCPELPITERWNGSMNAVGFTVSSTTMAQDVCRFLKIDPGAKARTVQMPTLSSPDLSWAFVRGLLTEMVRSVS